MHGCVVLWHVKSRCAVTQWLDSQLVLFRLLAACLAFPARQHKQACLVGLLAVHDGVGAQAAPTALPLLAGRVVPIVDADGDADVQALQGDGTTRAQDVRRSAVRR